MKTQNIFLKSLENQNTELLSERAIALRNMELLEVNLQFKIRRIQMIQFQLILYKFQKYLLSLTEAVKNHSLKEIERTHHLFAIDNVNSLYNSQNLSEVNNIRFLNFKLLNWLKCNLLIAYLNKG